MTMRSDISSLARLAESIRSVRRRLSALEDALDRIAVDLDTVIESRRRSPRPTISPIADARRARGLTQAQLARKAGMKRAQLCVLEKGQYTPRRETLVRLAAALDCNVSQLTAKKV